jgi:hypothetical protein
VLNSFDGALTKGNRACPEVPPLRKDRAFSPFCAMWSTYPSVCASLVPPAGNGQRYRLTVLGPGVTPAIGREGDVLPDFDQANPEIVRHEHAMNLVERRLDDPRCRQT